MKLALTVILLTTLNVIGNSDSFAEDFSYDLGKTTHRNLDVDSPKKQSERGLEPHETICRGSLYLIYKISDGTPACVNEFFSAPKLIERGWATLGKTSLTIITDKESYNLGDNVIITMKNDGETTLLFSGYPDFRIHNELEKDIELPLDNIVPPSENITYFDTFASTTFVWDQTTSNGGLVKPGTYTIYAKYMKPISSENMSQLNHQQLEIVKIFEII